MLINGVAWCCVDHTGSCPPTAMTFVRCTWIASPTTSAPASAPVASMAFRVPADTSATTATATVTRTETADQRCQPEPIHTRKQGARRSGLGKEREEEKRREKFASADQRCCREYCYYWQEIPWLTIKWCLPAPPKLNIRTTLGRYFVSIDRVFI